MKILYIITQADGGGAQKYTLALAKHFGGMLAAGTQDIKLFNAARQVDVKCFALKHLKREINPLHDFLAIWEIRKLIKTLEPDIVHLNSSKAGVLGSFAAVALKAKIIFTAHGFVFNEPLPHWRAALYLALEKVASSYRDFIITVSDADKKSALDNNLITENKIQTVYNGIPQISFLSKDEARKKLNLNEIQNKKIIGAIASSDGYPAKGIDVLEKASHLMKSNSLTVVRGNHTKRVNDEGKFRLDEYMPNISVNLKAFDILVIPSRKEGLPFVLLEAMQAGLPIVASKVGGIPEALDDAGLLVQPENPAALAEALDYVVTDENLAHVLSQKAFERSTLFTEEKMLEETEKIYQSILKK